MPKQLPHLFEFGRFRLDRTERLLFQDGVMQKIWRPTSEEWAAFAARCRIVSNTGVLHEFSLNVEANALAILQKADNFEKIIGARVACRSQHPHRAL
jgi:hypothetical protein